MSNSVWRKSSYSGGANNECVEVAGIGNTVMVRDTKNREGVTLGVSAATWRAFVTRVPALDEKLS